MSHQNKITCEEAVSRLYEYLDKEGSSAALDEVETHLDVCRHCCSRFAFEANLWQVVRSKSQESRCPDSLKDKIKNLIVEY